MPRPATAPSPPLTCPRCGYDVSGPIPTWHDAGACPLEGTCTECGLRFAWVDLFRPELLSPTWSFEHGRRYAPRRLMRTIILAFRPRTFWSEMRLESPLRPRRMVLFAAAVVLITYILMGLIWSSAGHAIARVGWYRSTWVASLTPLRDPGASAVELALWPFPGRDARGWEPPEPIVAEAGVLMLFCTLIPIPFCVIPATLARAKVRRIHLLRAWTYLLPTAAFFAIASTIWSWLYLHSWLSNGQGWDWLPHPIWSLLLGIPAVLWCTGWSYEFVASYLRLSQPKLVTSLMLLSAFLAAIAVIAYLPKGGLIEDVAYTLHRWFM